MLAELGVFPRLCEKDNRGVPPHPATRPQEPASEHAEDLVYGDRSHHAQEALPDSAEAWAALKAAISAPCEVLKGRTMGAVGAVLPLRARSRLQPPEQQSGLRICPGSMSSQLELSPFTQDLTPHLARGAARPISPTTRPSDLPTLRHPPPPRRRMLHSLAGSCEFASRPPSPCPSCTFGAFGCRPRRLGARARARAQGAATPLTSAELVFQLVVCIPLVTRARDERHLPRHALQGNLDVPHIRGALQVARDLRTNVRQPLTNSFCPSLFVCEILCARVDKLRVL